MFNNQFNPYRGYGDYSQGYNQQPMQYMQQPIQQQIIPVKQNNLNGKLIENEEMAKTVEASLDGNIMYLPLTDGSKIVSKQLLSNGTIKYTVYEKKENVEPKESELSLNDIQNQIANINNDDIKDMLKEIKDELKALKKASK